jgi:hypothetical protein
MQSKKTICLFSLLILLSFSLLSGCINLESVTEEEYLEVKNKYALTSISTDEIMLNKYINELANLRTKNSSFKKIIDLEFNYSNSMYYFSKALKSSQKLNYSTNYCLSADYTQTINYLDTSEKYVLLAQNDFTQIQTNNSLLRKNQGDILTNLINSIKDTKNSITQKC